jgi:hypothetical protein
VKPVLSSNWDDRRNRTTFKVRIEGTTKWLMFTDETLRDLQSQIDAALKGSNDRLRT